MARDVDVDVNVDVAHRHRHRRPKGDIVPKRETLQGGKSDSQYVLRRRRVCGADQAKTDSSDMSDSTGPDSYPQTEDYELC